MLSLLNLVSMFWGLLSIINRRSVLCALVNRFDFSRAPSETDRACCLHEDRLEKTE